MKNIWYVIVGLMACGVSVLHGAMADIRSESKLNHVLKKYDLAVVLFYKTDRDTRKNSELTSNIAELERMFKRVSDDDRYKDAKIMFVRVNVASDEAERLAEEYDVSTLPSFILFKDGLVVRDGGRNGSIAMKNGFIRAHALQLFIDQYLGETINTYVQINAERKRRHERTHRTYTYFGYGYGGYPYYGYYGSPYYGGSVGFGVSF